MIRSVYATRLTVYGERNMDNNKPYRTRSQKAMAKESTTIVDGTHVSKHGTTMHKETKFEPNKQQMKHARKYFHACGRHDLANSVGAQ